MKRILGLIIVALLTIGLVGAYTMAWFSDTETSDGNTWTAGTLNLVSVVGGTAVNTSIALTPGGDGLNGYVEFGLTDPVKPGSSGTITWTLTNTGNVAGTLTMVAATTFSEGAAPNDAELEADPSNTIGLGQKLMVWVTRGDADILGTSTGYVAMNLLAAALNLESQSLVSGTPLVYVLHWEVPTTVGNEIQGDTAELDITFTLTQTH